MYNYLIEKPKLFTEDGVEKYIKIRANVERLLNQSGAFKLSFAITDMSGDTWFLMACVDRMVEMKEIKEITGSNVAGQDRVFVSFKI